MNDSVGGTEDASSSLRSNWKFPAVVHFCRVFEGVLSLRQFSSDKFEAALLNPGDHSVFLSELISRLLYPGRKKNAQNPETWPTWETNLLKKVRGNWGLTMDHDPLEGQRHFGEVSSSEKLEILYLLTEIALQNSNTMRDTIRNTVEDPYLTADSVRCLPIGEDAKGDRYFLFSLRYEDCRLYRMHRNRREDAESDEPEPEWITVTLTLDDLRDFVKNLKLTKNVSEKKMYRYLSSILPEFERTERHRKKMEDRASLREQAPLLKRSSRIQEQAKRREKSRARNRGKGDGEGEGRNEDGGNDESQVPLDLGISREERMRLRNQRRELAEKGLRRVLTGRKRRVEYDGLTPLGHSVQCPRKKRVQNVRPSRNITKLVSIIWEKFRRPMYHRRQFESHLEACRKRRAAFPQTPVDLAARYRFPQRPLETAGGIRDIRAPSQESYRPSYVHPPNSVLLNLLHQRPVKTGYNLGALQMPRPLQNTVDFGSQQPSINASMQQNLMRYSQQREVPPSFMLPSQTPGLPDTLRRQVLPHHQQSHDLQSRHLAMMPHARIEHQVYSQSDYRGVVPRNGPFPNAFNQSLAEPGFARSTSAHALQNNAMHRSLPSFNGIPGYHNGYPGSARVTTLFSGRLTPSLVQFPVATQPGPVKPTWNMPVAGTGGGRGIGGDVPKLPCKPLHLPPVVPTMRPNGPPSFPFDTRRQQQTRHLHDNGSNAGQDPKNRYSPFFIRKK